MPEQHSLLKRWDSRDERYGDPLVLGGVTGITELSGMMEAAIRPAISSIKTRTSFLMATMGVSVLSAAFASNQAMSSYFRRG